MARSGGRIDYCQSSTEVTTEVKNRDHAVVVRVPQAGAAIECPGRRVVSSTSLDVQTALLARDGQTTIGAAGSGARGRD